MPIDAPQVVIISRADCSPCKALLQLMHRLQPELHFSLTERDVDTDPNLAACYGEKVPVVLIDGRETCSGVVTEEMLRRAIKGARWRKPVSRILSRLGLKPQR
jgi:hypothetical protein